MRIVEELSARRRVARKVGVGDTTFTLCVVTSFAGAEHGRTKTSFDEMPQSPLAAFRFLIAVYALSDRLHCQQCRRGSE